MDTVSQNADFTNRKDIQTPVRSKAGPDRTAMVWVKPRFNWGTRTAVRNCERFEDRNTEDRIRILGVRERIFARPFRHRRFPSRNPE